MLSNNDFSRNWGHSPLLSFRPYVCRSVYLRNSSSWQRNYCFSLLHPLSSPFHIRWNMLSPFATFRETVNLSHISTRKIFLLPTIITTLKIFYNQETGKYICLFLMYSVYLTALCVQSFYVGVPLPGREKFWRNKIHCNVILSSSSWADRSD